MQRFSGLRFIGGIGLLLGLLTLSGGARADSTAEIQNSKFCYYGGFGDSGAYYVVSQSVEMDFAVQGTSCGIGINGGSWLTTVDGGTPFTLTGNSGNFNPVSIFTGKPEASIHTVHMISNGGQTYIGYGGAHHTLTITGTATGLQNDTGYGQQTLLTGNANVGFEGAWTAFGNLGGNSGFSTTYDDTVIRFRGTSQQWGIWAYVYNQVAVKIEVTQDNNQPLVTNLTFNASTAAQWQLIPLTLNTSPDSSGAEHLYTIRFSLLQGQGILVTSIIPLQAGGAVSSTYTPPTPVYIAGAGDSIMAGTNLGDSRLSWFAQLCNLLGYNALNGGVSGITVDGYTSGGYFAQITAVSPAPAYCVVAIGTNNFADTATIFQGKYTTLLTNLLTATGWGATRFIVVGVIPKGGGYDFNIAGSGAAFSGNGFNNAIKSVIAGLTTAQQARVVYVDPYQWTGFSVANNLVDGVHPNLSGEAIYLKNMYAALYKDMLKQGTIVGNLFAVPTGRGRKLN